VVPPGAGCPYYSDLSPATSAARGLGNEPTGPRPRGERFNIRALDGATFLTDPCDCGLGAALARLPFSRSLPRILDPDAPQGFAAAGQGNPVHGT
jgi:hypothetical protein